MDPLIVSIYLFLVSTYQQSINNAYAGATPPKGTDEGKFIMTEGIEEFFQESLSIFNVLFDRSGKHSVDGNSKMVLIYYTGSILF